MQYKSSDFIERLEFLMDRNKQSELTLAHKLGISVD